MRSHRPVVLAPLAGCLCALLCACAQPGAPAADAASPADAALEPGDLSGPRCQASPPLVSGGCDAFTARGSAGKLPGAALEEISGVVVSRRNSSATTSMLWLHNDSGDTARLFAVAVGAVGAPRLIATYQLTGVTADDWEDIAIGPAPGRSGDFLYIGDIGNNFNRAPRRSSIQIYRIPEPAVDLTRTGQTHDVAGAERIDLEYPAGQVYDSEALLVDPQSGEIALLTKDLFLGPTYVLRAPPVATPMGPVRLQLVTDCDGAPRPLRLPDEERPAITGADVAAAGDAIVVRAYTGAFLWNRLPGETLAAALGRTACALPTVKETQGEAIGVTPDGAGYYTISEGAGAEINLFRRN